MDLKGFYKFLSLGSIVFGMLWLATSQASTLGYTIGINPASQKLNILFGFILIILGLSLLLRVSKNHK